MNLCYYRNILFISGKNIIYPKIFFGISGKFFSYLGKKRAISWKFFWYVRKQFLKLSPPPPLPPPVANISGKKFLDVLFYSKSAPQSLPPQLLEPSYAPAHRRTGAWGNISRSRKKFARRNLKEVAKTSSPRSKWTIDFLCYDFN
jgi:hypothetical protein